MAAKSIFGETRREKRSGGSYSHQPTVWSCIEIPHRNPDYFNMYVYNDFAGYGYQEVVENNVAEFNKILDSKDGKTEELWTILESMVYWIVEDPSYSWHGIDDGERS